MTIFLLLLISLKIYMDIQILVFSKIRIVFLFLIDNEVINYYELIL